MGNINFVEIASKLATVAPKDRSVEEWMNRFHYSISMVAFPPDWGAQAATKDRLTHTARDILLYLSISAPMDVFSQMQKLYDNNPYTQKTPAMETTLAWHNCVAVAYSGKGGDARSNLRYNNLSALVVWLMGWGAVQGYDMEAALLSEINALIKA